MPDCEYCSRTVEDEDAYIDHLAEAHEGELGRIDRRRVERRHGSTSAEGEDGPNKLVLYGLGAVFVLLIAGTVAAVLAMGGDDGTAGEERIHDHGHVTLEIDGTVYDFDRQPYYDISGDFHFHAGQGNYWHMHPTPSERLTLEEAMAELDKPITETSITVDGVTYDDDDPDTEVRIAVDGESVSPDYELQDGDHIEIVVETDE